MAIMIPSSPKESSLFSSNWSSAEGLFIPESLKNDTLLPVYESIFSMNTFEQKLMDIIENIQEK